MQSDWKCECVYSSFFNYRHFYVQWVCFLLKLTDLYLFLSSVLETIFILLSYLIFLLFTSIVSNDLLCFLKVHTL